MRCSRGEVTGEAALGRPDVPELGEKTLPRRVKADLKRPEVHARHERAALHEAVPAHEERGAVGGAVGEGALEDIGRERGRGGRGLNGRVARVVRVDAVKSLGAGYAELPRRLLRRVRRGTRSLVTPSGDAERLGDAPDGILVLLVEPCSCEGERERHPGVGERAQGGQ